jgi:hypothetical protein
MISTTSLKEYLKNVDMTDYFSEGEITVDHPKTQLPVVLATGDILELKIIEFALQSIQEELVEYGQTLENFKIACQRCDTVFRYCYKEIHELTTWPEGCLKKDFITTLYKDAGIYPE